MSGECTGLTLTSLDDSEVAFPAVKTDEELRALVEVTSDEADLCQNEGATDIAVLLRKLATAIETLMAERVLVAWLCEKPFSTIADIAARIAELEAKLAKAREIDGYLESAQGDAERPLYNELEVGFRHSPLSPKEKLQRYEDAARFCAEAIRRARSTLEEMK